MFNRLIAWFDHRYSPVALAANRQPPTGLWKFVFYFVGQFRTAFLIRLGPRCHRLRRRCDDADLRRPAWSASSPPPIPARCSASTGRRFLLMVAVIAIVRPLTFLLDTLVRNHAIVPNLVDLVRWQSHWHVIRQSWTYFQNDFAGRIANKVHAGRRGASRSASTSPSTRRGTPLVFVVVAPSSLLAARLRCCWCRSAIWLLLYGILFVVTMPLIARYSEELSEAKSVMTGRMVDSYTNIQTLKTFSIGRARGPLRERLA